MKRIQFYMLVLLSLMIFISCQQKTSKDQPIPKNEKSMIREWVKPIHKSPFPDFRKKSSLIVMDPYQEIWSKYSTSLGRFYLDINKDTIPELILKWKEEKGVPCFVIYKIVKANYLYLGYFSFNNFQLLESNHFGCQDFMIYLRKEAEQLGKESGFLQIYEFDGLSYNCVKEMDIGLQDAVQENIFVPDQKISVIYHPLSSKLQWSPKDDDKYRKMIK